MFSPWSPRQAAGFTKGVGKQKGMRSTLLLMLPGDIYLQCFDLEVFIRHPFPKWGWKVLYIGAVLSNITS